MLLVRAAARAVIVAAGSLPGIVVLAALLAGANVLFVAPATVAIVRHRTFLGYH
jgi:hypothetical protein